MSAAQPDGFAEGIPRLRPWGWLALLALIFMEMSWAALWFSALSNLGRGVSYAKALAVLSALLILSNLLTRLFQLWDLRLGLRRGLFAFFILLSLYLSIVLLLYAPEWPSIGATIQRLVHGFADLKRIPGEFWVMLVVLLLWRRGVSLAHQVITSELVVGSFRIGVLVLFLFGILPALFMEASSIFPALYLFLFFGLVAMSAARIADLSLTRGAIYARFERSWLAGIVVTALLVVAVGALLGGVIEGSFLDLLIRGILVALAGVALLALLITLPFVIVLFLVMPYMLQILRALALPFEALGRLIAKLQSLVPRLPTLGVQKVLDFVATQGKPVALWGILAVVGVGVLLALGWRTWRQRLAREVDSEALMSLEELLQLLRFTLRRRAGQIAADLARRLNFRHAERLLAAARVRWIYAQLMDLCEACGHPRPAARTPLEFVPELEELFPDAAGDLATITQAYLKVRYGELPETSQDVEVVATAWEHVQAVNAQRKKPGSRSGSREQA